MYVCSNTAGAVLGVNSTTDCKSQHTAPESESLYVSFALVLAFVWARATHLTGLGRGALFAVGNVVHGANILRNDVIELLKFHLRFGVKHVAGTGIFCCLLRVAGSYAVVDERADRGPLGLADDGKLVQACHHLHVFCVRPHEMQGKIGWARLEYASHLELPDDTDIRYAL